MTLSPTGLPLCQTCGRLESQHTNPLAHAFGEPYRRHSPSYSCGSDGCLTCTEARARQDAALLGKCAEARRFFGATQAEVTHG